MKVRMKAGQEATENMQEKVEENQEGLRPFKKWWNPARADDWHSRNKWKTVRRDDRHSWNAAAGHVYRARAPMGSCHQELSTAGLHDLSVGSGVSLAILRGTADSDTHRKHFPEEKDCPRSEEHTKEMKKTMGSSLLPTRYELSSYASSPILKETSMTLWCGTC
jgi:hypothetical protein